MRLVPTVSLAPLPLQAAFFWIVAGGVAASSATSALQAAPIHNAALSGDLSAARRLLQARASDVHALDHNGSTPLLLAAAAGRADIARLLLSRGAKVNFSTSNGHSSLHLAASYGHPALVELLLLKGANVQARDKMGWTALHSAVVPMWIAVSPARSTPPGQPARPAAPSLRLQQQAAQRRGASSLAVVRLLLRRGARADVRDLSQLTPLHLAAVGGRAEEAKLLVEAGAPVNARAAKKESPLYLAVRGGDPSLVRFLLAKGADPNLASAKGNTPLHLAAQEGHNEIVQRLLVGGARSRASNLDGYTPLHHAVQEGRLEAARLLLSFKALGNASATAPANASANALANARDTAGRTPLHLAAYRGSAPLIRLLLEHGADRGAVTKQGQTSLDVAKQEDHRQAEALLRRSPRPSKPWSRAASARAARPGLLAWPCSIGR